MPAIDARRLALAGLGILAALAAPAPVSSAVRDGPRTLSFLHVGPPAGPTGLPQILDATGREILLRGVNVDGLTDYWRPDLRPPYPTASSAYSSACPADDRSVEGVPVCTFDLPQMRPLGYDSVRLTLSWSLLEPAPGKVDTAYVDRIAQVVDWARAQGIYVVLDMHQDAWSKYVFTPPGAACPPPLGPIRGYDGAPDWASVHLLPACALNGTRELDAAVQEDFQRFYSDVPAPDGIGLQEHFAAAMTALARRFAGDPAVAGYEILNEPSPGLVAPDLMDLTELFPFYARVVSTVTAAIPGFQQLFFVEPDAVRNVTDQRTAFVPWSGFSSYANVVYAPHVYTGVFTIDALLGAPQPRLFSVAQGYANAQDDAAALGLPLWIGEYGNSPAQDATLLEQHFAAQDGGGVGGTLWLWKENANDVVGNVFWGVYGPPFGPGTPQPERIRITARAYPEALAGTLTSVVYDDHGFTFDLKATSAGVAPGDTDASTLVFVPATVHGTVVAINADVREVDRGGGAREAVVAPRGGAYEVRVGGAAADQAAGGGARLSVAGADSGATPATTAGAGTLRGGAVAAGVLVTVALGARRRRLHLG
jgi:endoglycosylceramidase